MARKQIKIELEPDNLEYLLTLKKLEQNKNKNISDLINSHIKKIRFEKSLNDINLLNPKISNLKYLKDKL